MHTNASTRQKNLRGQWAEDPEMGSGPWRTLVDSWKACTAVTLLPRAAARVCRGAAVGAGFALNTNAGSGATYPAHHVITSSIQPDMRVND